MGIRSRRPRVSVLAADLRFYFAFIQANLKKIRAGQGVNILVSPYSWCVSVPLQQLIDRAYFYRIIDARELLTVRP